MVGFTLKRFLAPLLVASFALADSQQDDHRSPDPDSSGFVYVKFGGKMFINKGIVAFGLIPSNFKESTGDTFGGVGSAIALKRGSWRKGRDGYYSGTLIVQPDRGFNIDSTIDYPGRQHSVDFELEPYYGAKNLTFADAKRTLGLKYRSTLLYSESDRVRTTGLDPVAVRPSKKNKGNHRDDPVEPIASHTYNRLSLDSEGLVLNADHTFWVSDEYGPYIHLFSPSGTRIRSIEPPKAILPFLVPENSTTPVLNFTASVDPTTGRTSNQGFEGLSTSPDGSKVFALLQSATIQDGGSGKTTGRNTRLFEYDTSGQLHREYVVPLPVKVKNGNVLAQSELHYLSDTQFLTLARDGDGNGGDDANSAYKSIDLFDISRATNIAHSKYDDPSHPIAVNGTVVSGITPAVYEPFVSIINDTQLARFGLHNGKPIDETLINSKWESIALAPVQDPKYPDDYFLFAASDNDFLTTDGVAVGQPYNASQDVDNQFLVYRVTLPNVSRGSVEHSIGISSEYGGHQEHY